MERRNFEFKYLTENIGRGPNRALSRLNVINENTRNVMTVTSRNEIERTIIENNEKHLKKAQSSKVYYDKVYKNLACEMIRDKILRNEFETNDCDDANVFDFLKLVAKKTVKEVTMFTPMTCGEWEKVVRRSKRKSSSSIFQDELTWCINVP